MDTLPVRPEAFLFIERGVPVALWQLVSLLVEDMGQPLCTDMNGPLLGEKLHAFLAGRLTFDDLFEGRDQQFVAGFQNSRRIREVLVITVVVVSVERLLLSALMTLLESGKTCDVVVVRRHRDDAEVNEQAELHDWLGGRRGFRGSGNWVITKHLEKPI